MKMKNEGYFAADNLLTLSAFIRATFLLALITYSQTSPSLSLSLCVCVCVSFKNSLAADGVDGGVQRVVGSGRVLRVHRRRAAGDSTVRSLHRRRRL